MYKETIVWSFGTYTSIPTYTKIKGRKVKGKYRKTRYKRSYTSHLQPIAREIVELAFPDLQEQLDNAKGTHITFPPTKTTGGSVVATKWVLIISGEE